MKQILLICSEAKLESLLVETMEAVACEAGVECKIFALPISEAPKVLEEVDCILLCPQVRFEGFVIERLASGCEKGPIPVATISMRDYGTMNGKAILNSAMKMMNIYT